MFALLWLTLVCCSWRLLSRSRFTVRRVPVRVSSADPRPSRIRTRTPSRRI